VGSQIIILGNDGEKDVLEIRTYVCEENVLLLHDTLYATWGAMFFCVFYLWD